MVAVSPHDAYPAQTARTERLALALILFLAAAVRLWVVATHTYVAWPDETFQYLEPAHRLVFGSGVITWEYLDGVRSWLLPGVAAAVMALVSPLHPDPAAYMVPLRLLCVLASLVVPLVGFRLVARRCGLAAGVLAGLLCAFASELVYFAPVILAEPLATDAALAAILLGDGGASRRRLLAAGLLFGLAGSLRYQYAPVLGLVALVQHARSPRHLALVAAAGLAVAALLLGGLEWLTWGAPFQSVWLNIQRNTADGISAALGTQPPFYYVEYELVAWGALAPVLLACAALGSWRLPVLAAAVLGTLGLHALVPHKELRFVFLSTACLPILTGAGLGSLLRLLPRLRPVTAGVPVAVVLGFAVPGYTAVQTVRWASPPNAWHRDRSELQVTAAARTVPDACGLAIRGESVFETGGYTYWHRDAPVYFETWDEMQRVEGLRFTPRLAGVLDRRPVPQYPGASLAAHTDRFNVMIGRPGDALPGFARRGCFGRGSVDDPELCLFVRPGGCG